MITEISETPSSSTTFLANALLLQKQQDQLQHRDQFDFHFVENAQFGGINNKSVQQNLFKWGMQGSMYMKRFTYDQMLMPHQVEDFIDCFFNSPQVNPHIKTMCTMDRWGTLGKVSGVHKEETLHSVTSLAFFDRLFNCGILRLDGEIKKCLDEYVDPPGFLVSDELRKCLVMPVAETYDIFEESDRKQFIFHVFKALCLGGKLCQYEDYVAAYLEATKLIYKDLVSVRKNPDTGELQVSSKIYKITGFDNTAHSPLFPLEHPQNFCYISIKGIGGKGSRVVDIWYHSSDVYYQ